MLSIESLTTSCETGPTIWNERGSFIRKDSANDSDQVRDRCCQSRPLLLVRRQLQEPYKEMRIVNESAPVG